MPPEITERPQLDKTAYAERAKALGYDWEHHEPQEVYVTGFAQRTPLGMTFQTSDAMYDGESGIRDFNVQNHRTNVAGPLPEDYDPYELLHKNDTKRNRLSKLQAMGIENSREAVRMAGLLDEESGHIPSPPYNADRIAAWMAAGVADTPFISVEINNTLYHTPRPVRDAEGRKIINKNGEVRVRGVRPLRESSELIRPATTLSVFPEEGNAVIAVELGASGWGGTIYQACAGGAAAIVEGARLIREGRADVVIAGGMEEALGTDPNGFRGALTIGEFAAFGASADSSKWDDPTKVSRPFDKDRNGFVPSSGIGTVVLESKRHMMARDAKAYAKVVGFANSMDGRNPNEKSQLLTELVPNRVARTVFDAIRPMDEAAEEGDVMELDATWGHATSTSAGDRLEPEVLYKVFGKDLRYMPISAIKSAIGHLLGAAGGVNAVSAIIGLLEGRMPHILNLDNPDPEITKFGLEFVRNESLYLPLKRVLALGYGFGRYNAALVFERPEDDLAVDKVTYLNYKNQMLAQAA